MTGGTKAIKVPTCRHDDRFIPYPSGQRLILALLEGWYHHRVQGQHGANKTSNRNRRPGNFQAFSVWVVSNQMEAAMYKYLASITGTLVILSGVLLVSGRAEAGASASAPLKYSHASQVAAAHHAPGVRQARRTDFGITEYSSSSARNHSRQR
jgi:hypothetical protein